MFRRRPHPAPVPPPRVVEDAAAPIQDAGQPTPPLTSWQDAVNALVDGGYLEMTCPHLCRRKGDHAHMRHEAASTDLIVSPAAVERGGA